MASKHFIQDPTIVHDALRAQTYVNPSLKFDSDNKVLINSQHDGNKNVTLISGGGAGHEPSFAGFVGNGMLSAAVSGSIFASPSANQIYNAIIQVGGKAGTLLVIMNYTGDVLHFHLAAEKACLAGHHTEVLVVGDDVSVGRKKSGRVGRRGLAGTVLVHKILGAMAAEGASLKQLVKTGELLCDNLATVGASLDHVHVPGRASAETAATGDQMELGMGIHNEPGCKVLSPVPHITVLVRMMLDQLLDLEDKDRAYVDFVRGSEIVLLVNNLGGLSPLEFSAIVKVVNDETVSRDLSVAKTVAGTFMTSLDGKGFSITLLKTDQQILDRLESPSSTAGWPNTLPRSIPNASRITNGIDSKVKDAVNGTKVDTGLLTIDLPSFKQFLTRACGDVIAAEPIITQYDTVVGDGDCGTTLARAARAILDSDRLSTDAVSTIEAIAEIIEETMDGTSGALYAIFFNAFGVHLKSRADPTQKRVVGAADWIAASYQALQALQRATPARIGDRTLMDSLIPFVDSLQAGQPLQEAVNAAKDGRDKTRGMIPAFGRAVYVNESGWDKVPDPGAEGIVQLVQSLGK